MKNFSSKFIFFGLFLMSIILFAQKNDTVVISPKNLEIKYLKEGKSKYLVYFKKDESAPISDVQIWEIDVKKDNYNGKNTFNINQVWYHKDTIVHHAKSVSLVENFKTLYHESWWKMRGLQIYNVEKNELTIDGKTIDETESNPKKLAALKSFRSSEGQYYLNWHLDLETFELLPFKKNTTFLIPFYEFGYDKPSNIPYSVIGEEILEAYDGAKINCWILKHEEKDNVEKYWISKKTHEVLKMEQKFGKMYRYKIKIPF